jgi:hypothetical protein
MLGLQSSNALHGKNIYAMKTMSFGSILRQDTCYTILLQSYKINFGNTTKKSIATANINFPNTLTLTELSHYLYV